AWHCYYMLFLGHKNAQDLKISSWPAIPDTVHKQAPLFYIYIFAQHIPAVFTYQSALGIPRPITVDTLSDLILWIEKFRRYHGQFGFDQMHWLNNHFHSSLFRLGRLQFNFSALAHKIMALKNSSGNIELILDRDTFMRPDGNYDGADSVFSPQAWQSTFTCSSGGINAHRINERGLAEKEATLFGPEYKIILAPGDSVLGMHIPETGPLDIPQCVESIKAAEIFFPRYFPSWNFSAFTCQSWLCDSQLADYLEPDSNIIKFLKLFRLYPLPHANDHNLFTQIFGRVLSDYNEIPEKSSLHRAIKKHIQQGGKWRISGGIILRNK
ncbi:MAG TPA: hypothetical protein DC049_17560, partial [Spirochaetia bacterium]|nr:hypothetical protein [Spirochaetia bacterium]